MKNNRYFIVAYAFPGGVGNCNLGTTNGEYLNRQKVTKKLESNYSTIDSFIITNVIELSEKDYDCFFHEEKITEPLQPE